MNSLSVIILTRNEEAHIAEAVQNARLCTEEVVIIDSGSTDRTVELAEQYGAKVFFRAWDGDFSAQRNFALTKTAADGVLYLDADERLTPETIDGIHKVLSGNRLTDQYRIQRKVVSFGKTFEHGAMHPDHVMRLFPRAQVQWVGKVHEHPECSCPIRTLPGYLEHYTYRDWSAWEKKAQLYTSIWAEDAYRQGKRISMGTPFAHAFLGFLRMLLPKAGFLDGWLGIYMCFLHFFYTLMKYLKLLELQRNK